MNLTDACYFHFQCIDILDDLCFLNAFQIKGKLLWWNDRDLFISQSFRLKLCIVAFEVVFRNYNAFTQTILLYYFSLFSLSQIFCFHPRRSVCTIFYAPICFLITSWCISKTAICFPALMNYSWDLYDSDPAVSDWDEWSFFVIHFVVMIGEHIVTLHSKPLEAVLAKGRNDD